MKKSFVLLSALVLLLAGCSEITTDTDTETDSTSSESTESEPSESTPSESTPTTPTEPSEGGLPEGATEMTFKDQNDVVSEAASIMYFWNEQDENHVDIDLAYNLNNTSYIEYSVQEGLNPVWYGIQLFLELSNEDKATYGLTEGDEYTVSLSLKSSVSGKITVNGVETDITAGDNTISVTSTTRIGATQETWDAGTSSDITLYIPTLLIQLGTAEGGFLGAATIEVSNLSFAKTETSDTTEAITASGLSNVNGQEGQTDGKMHYWANSATVNEATHYLNEDKYVIDYSNATGDWWGFQIFWMLDTDQLTERSLTEGSMYSLSLTLESSVSASIKVLGSAISINQGSNEITDVISTVNSTSGDNATFHIWMGDGSSTLVSSAKVEISNIVIAPYEAPTTWANTYDVDFSSISLSTQSYGDEVYAQNNPGTLCRWANESSWGGEAVTVSGESLTASGYTASYSTNTNSYWYGFQLFYQTPESTITTGATFYVEMKINVNAAVSVTINDQVVALSEGDNEVTVVSGHTKDTTAINWDSTVYKKTDLEFQAGTSTGGIAATSLTLTISALSFHWE